jgi:Zn-dependent protease
MRSGFSIGRIFGIRIFIDWSWILIFLLVTWNLAGALFPRLHPEWSLGLNLAMGLLASLLFFGSVLAHELAHSLVAKARGLPVRRITLFIFGAFRISSVRPDTPLSEFLIAVVGPLTSLVLGLLFLFLGRANIANLPSPAACLIYLLHSTPFQPAAVAGRSISSWAYSTIPAFPGRQARPALTLVGGYQ